MATYVDANIFLYAVLYDDDRAQHLPACGASGTPPMPMPM